MPPVGRLGHGSGLPAAVAKLLPAMQSASGVRPTAPLNVNGGAVPPVVFEMNGYEVTAVVIPFVVAGSPGTRVPVYTVLNTLGTRVPARPAAISARPDNGPNENINVCTPLAMVE